jgi:hypothetical protein
MEALKRKKAEAAREAEAIALADRTAATEVTEAETTFAATTVTNTSAQTAKPTTTAPKKKVAKPKMTAKEKKERSVRSYIPLVDLVIDAYLSWKSRGLYLVYHSSSAEAIP